ncbi:MAG TPA: GTPase domain-containing protein, partial [Longimicrobium sp.]|nr:GTPase domain-containing protein [Longimicrobium sp.]
VSVRLSERLRRDLLPRVASDEPLLLVAIAGPNNVGKSSLFNSLVRKPLSPARAEGGLTKQCLASAHPRLWESSLRELIERRYEVVLVGDAPPPVDQQGPPGRLYLALSPDAPEGLLVMDTPDFDSIYRQNRANTEALLVTVDVVLFMVSRQTYQNAALVDFLKEAVGHGRPYLLVYNEAARLETARVHLDKLADDVGQPPLARYFAGHQPEVEAGHAFLSVQPLAGDPPLPVLLSDPTHVARLKAQALSASLADAGAELELLAGAVRSEATGPERLRARLRHELTEVGARAAQKGVPADILIEAFRDELDARSAFHRWVRLPFRGLATALTFLGRKVHESFTGPTEPKEDKVGALSEEALKDGVRRTVEALAPEVSAWRGDAEIRRLLEETLGPVTLDRLSQPLDMPEVRDSPDDRAKLYAFCRELIAEELRQGGDQETALQALTTLVYSVPAGAAALVSVATGGVGHDAAIWAGTLLSTPLLEKFVDMLGYQIRSRVTKTWTESHGATLARGLERRFFAPLLEKLDATVAEAQRRADALTQAREALR